MWGLRVLLMVGVIAYTSSEEVIPLYAKCANILFNRVQTKLTADIGALQSEIEGVSRKLDVTCGHQPQVEVEEVILPSPNQVIPSLNLLTKMEELIEKVNSMDGKLNEALTRMTVMENALKKTEEVDLSHLNGSIAAMVDQSTKHLHSQLRRLPTKEQVQELVVTHVGGVQEAVREGSEGCGSNAKLTEVLQEVKVVKSDIERVTNDTEATKEEVKRCTQQDTTQELRSVMTRMETLQGKVEGLEIGLEEDLQYVKGVLVEVFNNTMPPPPPPTTSRPTLPPGQITPCEDSTFRGTNAINVCQTAVRFNKCRLAAVAYHCCHTCTTEGRLPEMGPWRYVDQNRDVTTLDVVRFFARPN